MLPGPNCLQTSFYGCKWVAVLSLCLAKQSRSRPLELPCVHRPFIARCPNTRPDGWVYMSGGCAWCKWTVMPMAVTLVVMHSVVQVCTVSVMHGHRTGRSQISVSVSVTLFMVDLAVGPRAATITLSRNCDSGFSKRHLRTRSRWRSSHGTGRRTSTIRVRIPDGDNLIAVLDARVSERTTRAGGH